MLSMKPIGSASEAAHYFLGADNYYLSDEHGKEFSGWFGEGAKRFGLVGQVEAKQFTAMLNGYMPDGSIVGLQKDGSIKHRPGFDLTFSAPKSVSILALVLGNKEFIDAHSNAVNAALHELEKICAQARKTNGQGELEYENTHNLIIAQFLHDTSRALDPALHTHNVVMNATQRLDKLWRALASSDPNKKDFEKNGFYERVLGNQFYFSNIYRSTLAKDMVDKGFEIEIIGPHGMWEIKNFPKEVLDTFSKRRKAIKENLNARDLFSAKAADVATQNTRDSKQKNIERTDLHHKWIEELKSTGYTPEKLMKIIKNEEKLNSTVSLTSTDTTQPRNNRLLTPQEAIKESVSHFSEYQASIEYSAILTKAMEFSLGQVAYKELSSELDRQISADELINLDNKNDRVMKGFGQRITTKELIEKETLLLKLAVDTKNSIDSIKVEGKTLSEFQVPKAIKTSIVDILKSKDRLTLVDTRGIQGNKKDFLSVLLNVTEHEGKAVKILTPSRLQANTTSQQIQREPKNLWRWLVSIGKGEAAESVGGFLFRYEQEINRPFSGWRQEKDVLIVEQAEKLSYQDTKKLIKLTEKQKARVIFLNNDIQGKANRFLVGSPVDILKQSSIEKFELKVENTQFKKTPVLSEIKEDKDRLESTVKAYQALSVQERDNSTLIVSNKRERQAIIPAIREILKNQGELGRVEKSVMTYKPFFLSETEKKFAHQYKEGLVIRLYEKTTSNKTSLLGKNENSSFGQLIKKQNQIVSEYKITNVLKKENILILEDSTGKIRRFNPRQSSQPLENNLNNRSAEKRVLSGIQIFEQKSLSLSEGELLVTTASTIDDIAQAGPFIWIKASSPPRLKSGDKLRVIEINKNGIKVEKFTGKVNEPIETLHIKNQQLKNLPIDYDYAHTLGKLPDSMPGKVIASLKDYLLNQDQIDQLAKKSSGDVLILTNNAANAQRKLEKHTRTAIDIVVQSHARLDGIERQLQARDLLSIQKDVQTAIKALNHQTVPSLVEEAVSFAIEKLSEREAAFSHQDLINTALEYSMDKMNPTVLDLNQKGNHSEQQTSMPMHKRLTEIINQKKESGELIMGRYFSDDTRWTTKESLTYEKLIIQTVTEGKNSVQPILSRENASEYLLEGERKNLTRGQRDACYLILTTSDQFVAVQGYAGTGKSTMFSSVKSLFEPLNEFLHESQSPIKKIIALAPTHKAVKELRDKGLVAQTVQSFLIEQKRAQEKGAIDLQDTLIIVDEISMVGNKDYSELASIIKSGSARAVMAGDITQLNAIPSGKPQQLLLDREVIAVAYMDNVVRQKEPILKDAVENVIKKDYQKAFRLLEKQETNRLIERDRGQLDLLNHDAGSEDQLSMLKEKLNLAIIECKESEAADLIAADLFSRTKAIQEKTLVVTDAHADRAMLHETIRENYKMTGELSKKEQITTRLVPSRIEKAEYQRITTYESGQVLKMAKDFYQITRVEKDDNGTGALHLIKESDGSKQIFLPHKEHKKVTEFYKLVREPIAVGEKIKLTRTDKQRQHFANEEYKVTGIHDGVLELENKNSPHQLMLDTKQCKDAHWDYAYTSTTMGAQGGTDKYEVAYINPAREQLVSYRSFGVLITRAEKHVTIFTPDKKALINKILNSFAEKYSAIEITEDKVTKKVLAFKDKNHVSNKGVGAGSLKKKQLISAIPELKQSYDAKEINRQLSENIEVIVPQLLGERNQQLSNSSNWRYGSRGSFSVQMTGTYQGTWHSFETGEKGNLLTLIQRELGLSFKEALEYAAQLTGEEYKQRIILASKDQKSEQQKQEDLIRKTEKEDQKKKNTTREYGRKLVSESLPITNTLAEHYLKEARKIVDVGQADLRFHPNVSTGIKENGRTKYLPAMLAIARDKEGNVMSVQATYLDRKTGDKAKLDVNKRTLGSLKDSRASCAISEGTKDNNSLQPEHKQNQEASQVSDKITYLAEGVETALSIKDVVKSHDIFAVLGKSNFKNVDVNKLNKTVILCIDNDGDKTFNQALFQAVKVIEDSGRVVKIHVPPALKKSGTDINDIVKMQGLDEAKKVMNKLIDSKDLFIHLAESRGVFTVKKHDHINESITATVKEEKQKSNILSTINRDQNGKNPTENTLKIAREIGIGSPSNSVPSHEEKPLNYQDMTTKNLTQSIKEIARDIQTKTMINKNTVETGIKHIVAQRDRGLEKAVKDISSEMQPNVNRENEHKIIRDLAKNERDIY